MKKIVYHGSDHIIERPEYGKGLYCNDYGRGFYCAENPELAKEWSCARNTDGYANRYEIDFFGLRILNLNDGSYNILNWLALLTRYRSYCQNGSIAEQAKRYLQENFLPDITGFDIIIGYRADDSYFSFAQDFISGAISLQKLAEAMHLGKLGEQIVLKSEKAFQAIRFTGYEAALSAEYFFRKSERDKAARLEYRKQRHVDSSAEDLFILDIMREEIKDHDSRLL